MGRYGKNGKSEGDERKRKDGKGKGEKCEKICAPPETEVWLRHQQKSTMCIITCA